MTRLVVRRCCEHEPNRGTNNPHALLQPLLHTPPFYPLADTVRLTQSRSSPFPVPHFHVPRPWLGYLLAWNATFLLFAYRKTPCSLSPRSNTTVFMKSFQTTISLSFCLFLLPILNFQSGLFVTLLLSVCLIICEHVISPRESIYTPFVGVSLSFFNFFSLNKYLLSAFHILGVMVSDLRALIL